MAESAVGRGRTGLHPLAPASHAYRTGADAADPSRRL